jgi:hypothetical protein
VRTTKIVAFLAKRKGPREGEEKSKEAQHKSEETSLTSKT